MKIVLKYQTVDQKWHKEKPRRDAERLRVDFPEHITDATDDVSKAIRELCHDSLQAAIKKVGDGTRQSLFQKSLFQRWWQSMLHFQVCPWRVSRVWPPVTRHVTVVILIMERVFIIQLTLVVILARLLAEKMILLTTR